MPNANRKRGELKLRDFRKLKYSNTNGFVARSRPIVVSGPCPEYTGESSGNANNTSVMACIRVG